MFPTEPPPWILVVYTLLRIHADYTCSAAPLSVGNQRNTMCPGGPHPSEHTSVRQPRPVMRAFAPYMPASASQALQLFITQQQELQGARTRGAPEAGHREKSTLNCWFINSSGAQLLPCHQQSEYIRCCLQQVETLKGIWYQVGLVGQNCVARARALHTCITYGRCPSPDTDTCAHTNARRSLQAPLEVTMTYASMCLLTA